MTLIFKDIKRKSIFFGVVGFMLLNTWATGLPMEKVYTIGIINNVTVLDQALKGFKEGMVESGYIEGENIKFIYSGLIESNEKIVDAEIKRLLAQKIDMLLVLGNMAALRAKKAVEGTDTPVLISGCDKPVEYGIIESMAHPGGNITGVALADSGPKALEWLKTVVPGLKKVLLPYNPNDYTPVINFMEMDKAASQMGLELIHHKIASFEEAVATIENLPDDIKAVFRIPSLTLDSRNNELSQAAIRHGIAMGARVTLDKDVLVTFANDLFEMGKKTARLACQIRQGVKPVDLPVEVSDVFLTINLKTAEKIGITIPDSILFQAKTIIR